MPVQSLPLNLATQTFDVIVVGAGSSGCALAARLSERSSRRVLLIEAGPHYPTLAHWPPELLRANTFASSVPGHPNNWGFIGQLRPGQTAPLPRGKVVGGSSAVNGTYFIRGRPEDFDHWAALGNPGWSYQDVLPYFARSERDLDFGTAAGLHGTDGPMPVRRARDEQLRPVSQAFMQACLDAGHALEPDKNAPGEPGVGPIPRNCVDGVRMNTALCYLAACIDRPNLTLLPQAHVLKVLVNGGRAVGVQVAHEGAEGGTLRLQGGEVVLCAGGIQSPKLLMLSGIGDANALRGHGIEPVLHQPAVGRGVKDHPVVRVMYRLSTPPQRLPPDFMPLQVCLNHTAPGSADVGDLQISCASASLANLLEMPAGTPGARSPWLQALSRPWATLQGLRGLSPRFLLRQAATRHELQLTCSLDLERSSGEIRLASANPAALPQVLLNYFDDPEDRRRMRANVRKAAALLAAPSFRALQAQRSDLSDAELADDAALDRWMISRLDTAYHLSCSARMGPADDPHAVVDARARVHGLQGLRVADLSICPTIVRRGPHATAVMLGERVAAFFEA